MSAVIPGGLLFGVPVVAGLTLLQTPGLLGDISDRVRIGAGGAVLTATGVLTATQLPKRIEDKNIKLAAQGGGLAVAAYGIYQIYKAVSEKIINPAIELKTGDTIGVSISNPVENDYWWKFDPLGKNITVTIVNPQISKKGFYVYFAIFSWTPP